VRKLSDEEIAQRRAQYEKLQHGVCEGQTAQVEEALNDREVVEPEMTPEIMERLQRRIDEARAIAVKERQQIEGYTRHPIEPGEFDIWQEE
jgi:hypothetical protein